MRLLELGVRHFRRFAGEVRIRPRAEGLTLIAGDNEEGKSSLVAALEAALFEQHGVGGRVLEAMRPWSGGDPEVSVRFRLGEEEWRIEKRFGRGAAARLYEGPHPVATGAEAERRLVELLRFEPRQGRAEPRPEHRGLFGLFWVQQGTGFLGFEVPDPLRSHLAGTIASEIDVAAGGGRLRAVVEQVRARAAALRTPGRRQETGELRELARELEAVRRQASELEDQWRAAEAKVAELGRLRAEAGRVARRDEIGEARERLRQLEAKKAELDRLLVEVRRAEAVAGQRHTELAELERRREHRRKLRGRIDAARREQAELAERRAAALHRVAEGEAAHATARARQQRLAEERDRLEQRRRGLRGLLERRRLAEELARLRADRERVADLDARLAGLGRALAASKVRADLVAELRRRVSEQAAARAALEAVATRLLFLPEAGGRVLRDGEPVAPEVPQLVTEPAEFALGGFGRLKVEPGAADLEERRRRFEDAKRQVTRLLAEMAVPDLAAAEAALREREARMAERERLAGERALLLERHGAGGGAELDAGIEALAVRLDELAADPDPGDGDPEALLADLERRVTDLQGEVEDAALATTRAAESVQAVRVELATLAEAISQAERRIAGLEGELAEETERLPDPELDRRMADARDAAERAVQEQGSLRAALGRLAPELLDEQLERQRRRVLELEAEERGRRERIRNLEAELRATGGTDLAERLARARDELARLERAYESRRREADAWWLLLDRLEAAQRHRREALTRPVVERVLPRLRRLFPDASLVLEPERLALAELEREGLREPFASLSVGTREQLAVLVRLALAELVADTRGDPPCLLLDDALVHTDEHRFEVMKGILEHAARERGMQILVLTCRPRDWLGVEAELVRLEECAAPSRG